MTITAAAADFNGGKASAESLIARTATSAVADTVFLFLKRFSIVDEDGVLGADCVGGRRKKSAEQHPPYPLVAHT
jgi:hypothetical protein